MKLGTFMTPGHNPRIGAVVPEGLLDLTAADGSTSLKEVFAEGPVGLARIEAIVKAAHDGPAADKPILKAQDITLLPPIPDPSMFFCVGKNYRDHLEELVRTELIRELPDEPTGFIKLNSVLVGQDAEVERPQGILQFDYEPELAFVIGKPGYRISRADAMDHVIGITAFNDLTAREIQKKEARSGTKFWTAKNMPGFGPVGPYIVTLDEVADIDDVWLTCSVNGERRSRFNTSGQIFKIPDIIEHFSRYMPLRPGDLFATGSAGGVAVAQANADELFLKPGDKVSVTLEPFMTLNTTIVG